jgi:Ca2+-binding RTX toxin-like protein
MTNTFIARLINESSGTLYSVNQDMLASGSNVHLNEFLLLIHHASRYDQQFGPKLFPQGQIPNVPDYLAHIGWQQVSIGENFSNHLKFLESYSKNPYFSNTENRYTSYVYNEGSGYGGFVYRRGDTDQYVLVSAGTKGGAGEPFRDEDGTLNADWLTNLSSGLGFTGNEDTDNSLIQPEDWFDQAADAFCRFIAEFDGKELYIAGDSETGMSNMLHLAMAKALGVEIKWAFGNDTLNISNALADELNQHFQELYADPDRRQGLIDHGYTFLAGELDKLYAGNFNVTTSGDIYEGGAVVGNVYDKYTIVNKENDIVANLFPPPTGADVYFVTPAETEAEFILRYYETNHKEVFKPEDYSAPLDLGSVFSALSYGGREYFDVLLDYLTLNHVAETMMDKGSTLLVQNEAWKNYLAEHNGSVTPTPDYGFYAGIHSDEYPSTEYFYHSSTPVRSGENTYTGPVTLTHQTVLELQKNTETLTHTKQVFEWIKYFGPVLLSPTTPTTAFFTLFLPQLVTTAFQSYAEAISNQDVDALEQSLMQLSSAFSQVDLENDYFKQLEQVNSQLGIGIEGRISNSTALVKQGEVIALPDIHRPGRISGYLAQGTQQSDLITSIDGDDVLIAGGGNDTVYGGVGDDAIYGGTGDDKITGFRGSDTLEGGSGDDTYYYSKGDGQDIIVDTEGENTLVFGDGIREEDVTPITTGTGEQVLLLNGTSDKITIQGSIEHIVYADNTSGDPFGITDVLEGSLSVSDTLDGGAGQDYVFGDQEHIFTTGTGSYTHTTSNDLIKGGSGDDALSGDSFSFTARNYSSITVNTGQDTVLGGSGNDEMRGDGIIRFEHTTSGSYTISVTTGNDSMDGGSGNDTMSGDGIVDAELGTGPNIISGTVQAGNDTLFGGTGNDHMLGDGKFLFDGNFTTVSRTLILGNDYLDGGAGNDIMSGDAFINHAWDTQTHNSSLVTYLGNDTLFGGLGDDYLAGDADEGGEQYYLLDRIATAGQVLGGNDSLDGGVGNDTLVGNLGDDTLIGGLGNDTYFFRKTDYTGYVDEAYNHIGDGNDLIQELGSSSDIDTVDFTIGGVSNNIAAEDVTFTKQGLDLLVQYNPSNPNDKILIKNQFKLDETSGRIENFKFSDNTVTTWQDILDAQGDASSNILGTTLPDFINAISTYQSIATGAGGDYIQLASLGDTADGGEGNDTIDAGSGNDTLIGGDGDDTFIVNSANVVIIENASEGNDTVISSLTQTLAAHVENLTLTGSANIDGTGNVENNQLTGNEGDNILDGGSGMDTLVAGAGDDTYVVDHTADLVIENLDEGHDEVQSSVSYQLGNNLEDLTLTGSADLVGVGNALNNVIQGNSGNNTLDGGMGTDTLIGSSGDDTFVIDTVDDVIVESDPSSNDTVIAAIDYTLGSTLENLTLFGIGNNSATGNAQNNVLIGNSGDNTLQGLAGDDSLDGGSGNDTYQFSSTWGADTITGDVSGSDTLDFTGTTAALTVDLDSTGTEVTDGTNTVNWSGTFIENVVSGSGNDTITGNAANNLLIGAGGNDTLDGEAGDDTYQFSGTWGADTITADASGSDTVDLSTVSNALTIDLDSTGTEVTDGTNTIDWSGNIIENVLSGSGADVIIGSSTANLIIGGQGNDTLNGEAGNDTYIFADNWGVDALSDSAGNDAVYLSTVTTNLTIDLDTSGTEITDGTNSINWSGTAIEHVAAGSGDDSITGNASDNQLSAGGGNDTLDGESGNDTYLFTSNWGSDTLSDSVGTDTVDFTGNTSNLTVDLDSAGTHVTDGTNTVNWSGTIIENAIGGSGADSITGNAANNLLSGGMGIDTLIGEAGDDVYVVDHSLDVVIENSAEGTDTIQASASYTLSANVENLTLTGTGFISGTGNNLANQITGNSGNNTLDGLAGNDSLDGSDGDDTYRFSGTWGSDTITADVSGSDTVDLSTVSNSLTIDLDSSGIEVTDGTNTVNWSGTFIENAMGGSGADSITGNALGNVLNGGAGTDTLDGEAGDDIYRFSGTWGSDIILDASGTDTVILSGVSANLTIDLDSSGTEVTDGANTVEWSGTLIENASGGFGNDAITGNSTANVLSGNSGNDTLDAEGGNDTIAGGSGNDLLIGGGGSDSLDGGSGNDAYQFSGTWGADTITADLSGSDTVDLSTVSNGLSIDLDSTGIEVTDGTNTVNWSGTFIENAMGGAGADSITGNALGNVLNGGAGNDTLDGEAGDDSYQFSGTWGADVLTDASGADTVDLSTVSNALSIDLDSTGIELTDGTNTIDWSGTIIENAIGGTAADSITGSAADNRLVGNGGDDSLDGEAGNDTYAFSATWGADVLADASGADTVDLSTVSNALTIDLDSSGTEVSDGTNTINWSGTIIENATAGSGNDELTGSGGANALIGNAGDDTLDGDAGNDTISGGSGNDLLIGGTGDDSLDGGSGDDTYQVSGTWGADIITVDDSGSDTVDLSSVSANLTIDLDSTVTEVTDGTNTIDWNDTIIENVLGGSGDDNITGSALDNRLIGNGGNDTLDGDGGDDLYAFADSWGQDQLVDSSGVDTLDFTAATAGLTIDLDSSGTKVTDGTNTIDWSESVIENVIGGSSTDAITGNAIANILSGGAGNDTISAAGGNDLVLGDAGDDQLDGGSGDDAYQFTGTWGADTISSDAEGNDLVDFSTVTSGLTINLETSGTKVTDGTNTVDWTGTLIENVLGGTAADAITGSSLANVLVGNTGNDMLTGVDGDDILLGGAGSDDLDGGNGNDQYLFSEAWGADTISGDASGTDTLDFSSVSADLTIDLDSVSAEVSDGTNTVTWVSSTIQIEQVLGGSGSDDIRGNDAANLLSGANGDDTLSAGAEDDTLIGGTGNDSLDGGADNDLYQFSGNWGIDSIADSAGTDQLNLSTSFSSITVDLNASGVNVTDGVNTIDWTGSIIEQITTGAGNDSLTGSSANNLLVAGNGSDTLDGVAGNDTLDGGTGNDSYQFSDNWDVDTILDASGTDTVDLSDVTSNLTVDLDSTGVKVTDSTNTIDWDGRIIENLIAGTGADSITGSNTNNWLNGHAGSDTIYGEEGNDTLIGGSGNDGLDGGEDDDTYQFSGNWGTDVITDDASGTDLVDLSSVTASLTIDLDNTVQITDGINTVSWTGALIENAAGGTGNDSITGNELNNRLSGNAGNDAISGEDGNDTLIGGTGNDSLDGGTGNDTYRFEADWGTDTISGDSSGTDSLDLSGISTNLTIDLASVGTKVTDGTNTVNWSGDLIEAVISGAEDDLITGNSQANILEGGSGDDTINGGLGNDTFVYSSAWGVDSLSDAGGMETIDLSTVLNALTIDLTSGTGDEVTDGQSTINWSSDVIESVVGGFGDDSITGNTGDNSLAGGRGQDTLNAGSGNDTLIGGLGNDSLLGGTGNDLYRFANNWGADDLSDTSGTDTLDLSNVITSLTVHMTSDDGMDVYEVSNGTNTLNWSGSVIETVITGSGDDNIVGTTNDDSMVAGAGSDVLDGNGGSDTLAGGIGDDVYLTNNSGVTITENSGEGTDTVQSSLSYTLGINLENLTLTGTSDLTGTGNSANNRLTGNAGNNTLDGGTGADTMVGRAGNDVYIVDNVGDVVTETFPGGRGGGNAASEGIDTVEASISYTLSANVENLTLTGSADLQATGNSLNNILTGNGGNNTLEGIAGDDTLDGSSGDDVYLFNAGFGTDSLVDSAGVDTLDFTSFETDVSFDAFIPSVTVDSDSASWNISTTRFENIFTGSGNDSITTADEANYIDAGAGNDSVNAATGNDTVYGGDGNDSLNGGGDDDLLDGGNGDDTLIGNLGSDTLYGQAGDDLFVEGTATGDDQYDGGSGTNTVDYSASSQAGYLRLDGSSTVMDLNGFLDTLSDIQVVKASNDTVNGDIVDATGETSGVTVNLDTGDLVAAGTSINTLENFETIWGSSYDDSLTGNSQDNAIEGNDGNDSLSGAAGADLLLGGNNDDTLDGGAGDDTLNGGAGNDTYIFASGFDTDVLSDTSGIDTVDFSAFSGDVTFDAFASSVTVGSDSASWNISNTRFENIFTGSGNDYIHTADEDNWIKSGAGDDSVEAATGNDTIEGGTGNDTLNGSGGNDLYVFQSGFGADSLADSGGVDTLDFTSFSSAVTFNANTASVSVGTDSASWNIVYNRFENIFSGSGDDTMTTSDEANHILSGAGNDSVNADYGNDTLEGGTGNDTLRGSVGDDVYVFNKGDGQDLVIDYDTTSGNSDALQFGSSVSQSAIAVFLNGSGDLQIGYTDSAGDLITIDNFGTADYALETFTLSNGNYMTSAEINTVISDMVAYATANSVSFTSLSDVKDDSNLMAIVNSGWHS